MVREIGLQLPSPAGSRPAPGRDPGEVRLVRPRDMASVPAIGLLAGVHPFQNPPPFPSGPLPRPGAATRLTPFPPNSTFWMVEIDSRTGEFVTAFGET